MKVLAIIGGAIAIFVGLLLVSPDSEPLPAEPVAAQVAQAPPEPGLFDIDIVVIEQRCYGDECTYEYTLKPFFFGSLPPGGEYRVVYEILGGTEPAVGNLRLAGSTLYWDDGRVRGVPGAELSANVVDVVRIR